MTCLSCSKERTCGSRPSRLSMTYHSTKLLDTLPRKWVSYVQLDVWMSTVTYMVQELVRRANTCSFHGKYRPEEQVFAIAKDLAMNAFIIYRYNLASLGNQIWALYNMLPPALTMSTRSSLKMTGIERGIAPTPNTCVLSWILISW